GHRGRPVGAVCYLFGDGSCRHHCPATASACRRLCQDVQPRLGCGAEPVRNSSRPIDAVVLEEVAMDATVHDEAVLQHEMQATVPRSSRSAGDVSTRQAGEIDDVARRVSGDYPSDKPTVSSAEKPMAPRRGGAIRTVRFFLRKLATAGIAVVAVLAALVA